MNLRNNDIKKVKGKHLCKNCNNQQTGHDHQQSAIYTKEYVGEKAAMLDTIAIKEKSEKT